MYFVDSVMEFLGSIPLLSIFVFIIGLVPFYFGIRFLRRERQLNKRTILVLIPMIVFVLCGGVPWVYSYLRLTEYREKTTPLSSETVEVLCKNFALEKDHRLCTGKKDVYGPDFYDVIRDTFRPYEEYNIESSKSATFDEVEQKLGKYKYDCYPVVHQADGFSYFECVYDLRGDGEFIIGIMFSYPDNAVFRVMTPIGLDD